MHFFPPLISILFTLYIQLILLRAARGVTGGVVVDGMVLGMWGWGECIPAGAYRKLHSGQVIRSVSRRKTYTILNLHLRTVQSSIDQMWMFLNCEG